MAAREISAACPRDGTALFQKAIEASSEALARAMSAHAELEDNGETRPDHEAAREHHSEAAAAHRKMAECHRSQGNYNVCMAHDNAASRHGAAATVHEFARGLADSDVGDPSDDGTNTERAGRATSAALALSRHAHEATLAAGNAN